MAPFSSHITFLRQQQSNSADYLPPIIGLMLITTEYIFRVMRNTIRLRIITILNTNSYKKTSKQRNSNPCRFESASKFNPTIFFQKFEIADKLLFNKPEHPPSIEPAFKADQNKSDYQQSPWITLRRRLDRSSEQVEKQEGIRFCP